MRNVCHDVADAAIREDVSGALALVLQQSVDPRLRNLEIMGQARHGQGVFREWLEGMPLVPWACQHLLHLRAEHEVAFWAENVERWEEVVGRA